MYGKPCPGYRTDTIFRNETHKVEKLVKKSSQSPEAQARPQGGGNPIVWKAPVTSQEVAVARSGSIDSGSHREPSLSLYKVADSPWEERAICYFFDQYTTYDGTSNGLTLGVSHLGFLPSLYAYSREQEGQEGSASLCLRQAVDATAFMALGNESRVPWLTVKARSNYGKALRGLRQALESRSQAVKDESLATLALFSLFEDIAGERNGLSSSHRAGFELLMKLRGASQFGYQRGRDLFNFAYTHTHSEILALGEKPRFNTDWIIGRLDTSDPVHRLIQSAAKVSQIFMEATSAQAKPENVDAAQLFTWIDTGAALDSELSEWSQTLPNEWLPLVVHTPTGEPLVTYQVLFLSVVWNFYRAIRIVLQRLMLELRRIRALFLGPFPDDDHVLEVIQDMITDACRSIPFSLGDIDTLGNPPTPSPSWDGGKPRIRAFHGYSLLWPLWYMLACGMATPQQEQMIRDALVRVGSMLGIKMALKLAGYSPEDPGFQFVDPIQSFM